MKALIERLEAASGPDREIDCMIWAEVEGRDVIWDGNKMLGRSRRAPHDECWLGTIDPGQHQRNFSPMGGYVPPAPAYTGSLDAAVKLVPPDWAWFVEWIGGEFSEGDAQVWIPSRRAKGLRNERFDARSKPTPVIALCIVALQAMEETNQQQLERP